MTVDEHGSSAPLPRAATMGVIAAVVLMVVAVAVPPLFDWDVQARVTAPLSAQWRPRIGPGTFPALALGGLMVAVGPSLAAGLRWRRMLSSAFGFSVAWLTALALVDGWRGIGGVLNRPSEYLTTARHVTNISATLHEYIGRISAASPQPWPTHVAGHPPGALLFFVMLARLGLGNGYAAGFVVLLIAATTPLAVLITVRRLAGENFARGAAPLLVAGPSALWLAVSADAMFGAVAAWGLCTLAVAATARTSTAAAGWSLLAGLLLGYCLFLSYGLALLGFLALGVLVITRRWLCLLWGSASAAGVALAFAAAGFVWWRALGPLHDRYYSGVASLRPAAYWVWGDLAALCFSAGPVVGASVAIAVTNARSKQAGTRALVLLTLAASLAIAAADASLLSKGEVERIWLPFVPWLVLCLVLLPPLWRRRALAVQVALALGLQTLLLTHW